MTAKENALRAISDLPDDATIEQILARLYVVLKTDKGIKELDAGKGIAHAKVLKRLGPWTGTGDGTPSHRLAFWFFLLAALVAFTAVLVAVGIVAVRWLIL